MPIEIKYKKSEETTKLKNIEDGELILIRDVLHLTSDYYDLNCYRLITNLEDGRGVFKDVGTPCKPVKCSIVVEV